MILVVAGLATRRRLRAALRLALRDQNGALDIRLVSPPDLSLPGWTHDPANPASDLVTLDGRGRKADAITAVLTALDAVLPADLPHVRAADRVFVAAEMTAFLRDWLATRNCPVLDPPTTLALGGPAGERATWSAAAAALGVPDRQGTQVPGTRTQTFMVAAGRITAPALDASSGPTGGRLNEIAATAVALTRAAGVTAARVTFTTTACEEAPESVPALCMAVPWWHSPDPRALRALLAAASAPIAPASAAVPAAPFLAAASARDHASPARHEPAGRPRSQRPLVLLWGIPEEETLRAVRAALANLGTRTTLIDQQAAMSSRLGPGPCGEPFLRLDGARLPLADVTATYPRPYPSVPEIRSDLPARAVARRHVLRLEHELWHWLATTPALVLNRPGPAAGNATKPAQSRAAAGFGFQVPDSLLTNDPAAARAFAARHGQVIYKGAGGSRTITGMLDPADTGRLARLATCPTYLQRRIAGSNVRVHVVGAEVFAVEVDSEAVDYRRHVNGLRSVRLPPDVADACRAVTAELGLRLAGIDLIRTPAGDWYFLEANTSPGFTFYPDRDMVADAIARLLSHGQ